jgi:hypothetical protein
MTQAPSKQSDTETMFESLDAITNAIRLSEPEEDRQLVSGFALYLITRSDREQRLVLADQLEHCLSGEREVDPTRERELLERLALSPARAAVRALIDEMRK